MLLDHVSKFLVSPTPHRCNRYSKNRCIVTKRTTQTQHLSTKPFTFCGSVPACLRGSCSGTERSPTPVAKVKLRPTHVPVALEAVGATTWAYLRTAVLLGFQACVLVHHLPPVRCGRLIRDSRPPRRSTTGSPEANDRVFVCLLYTNVWSPATGEHLWVVHVERVPYGHAWWGCSTLKAVSFGLAAG